MKLGDICTNQSSNIKQGDLESHTGDYPIYGAGGFIKNVDFYKQDKPYVGIVKDGAGIGRVMLLPAYSSIIGTMQYIIPNPDTDVKYLAYAMEHMNLAKYFSGATIPHIYFKDYKNEPIKEHDLSTQKEIAATLDKATHTIDLCNAILEKLDLLVKARFVELFGDDIKTTNLTIGDIADEATVGIANSATHAYSDEGVVMLRNQNIRINYLDDTDLIYITPKFAAKYESKALKENDILITRTGVNVGMACLVPKKYEGCQTFTTLILRLKKDIGITPMFVCHFINSPLGKDFIDNKKVGGAQPNFGAKQLVTMPIVIPSQNKQERFENMVYQTDKSKAAVKALLQKAETLKKALMQEYFG